MSPSGPSRSGPSPFALLFAALGLALLLGPVPGCGPAERDSGGEGSSLRGAPLVLIVIDTLRADHLESYGYARATSPHLAAWAASGRVYERALATSPWTLPSVASILTGHLPSRHRAGEVPLVDGRKPGLVSDPSELAPLAADVTTLAESLQGAGYSTGAVVTNTFLGESYGLHRGFDHYDYAPAFARRSRSARQAVDAALAWVDAQAGRPFFLMVHLFDPHLGYDAPPPFRGRFTREFEGGRYSAPFLGEKGLGLGLVPLEERDRDFVRAAYDEEVAWVDSQVERLRAGLADRGLLDGSLVVLTSDHGEEFFEHGGFEHGQSMFLEVLHVPLIFWGPGVVAGRESAWVSVADVTPTVREAFALPSPNSEGRSLWGNLTRGAALENIPVYAESNLYGPRQRTVVHWPDKLTRILELDLTLLFDLSQDPGEQQSVSDRMPERAGRLAARLEEALDEARADSTSAGGVVLDADAEASLRSLGYVESAEGGSYAAPRGGGGGADAPAASPAGSRGSGP